MKETAATYEDVTGAVLIGGKSRRLGQDKVLLPYDGKPIAAHLYGLLKSFFPRVLLIGHPRPELEALGFTCMPDRIKNKGVLGGIYTALEAGRNPYVFAVGADMPFITPSLITRILNHRHHADAVIPRGLKGLEPLCAVYSASCIKTIKLSLQADRLKVMTALGNLTVLSPEVTPDAGEPDLFLNINYPEDLEKLKTGQKATDDGQRTRKNSI